MQARKPERMRTYGRCTGGGGIGCSVSNGLDSIGTIWHASWEHFDARQEVDGEQKEERALDLWLEHA